MGELSDFVLLGDFNHTLQWDKPQSKFNYIELTIEIGLFDDWISVSDPVP